ncbi:hypothetical protein MNBD_CHLOROFLEXI01-213 [hydrothermal vent metagenome]|uniref:Polysaccharide biosynthesis protein C-terminal domain-containing protein n=1 Tax=hydrothermal vent metagenome TaxID=652676 RepID=A0A3B0US94_9ZZZZ
MPSLETDNEQDDIATRTLQGSIYTITAAIITLILGLIRLVLLLKFLQPDQFGVVTQALLIVNFTTLFSLPGLDKALIQRQSISKKGVLPTYFTLRLGLVLIVLSLLLVLTPIISRFYSDFPLLAVILTAVLFIDVIKALNSVQETILSRQLSFRNIAIANVVSGFVMTIVAPTLAWQGWGAWSLVAESGVGQLTRFLIFWLLARAWTPRFGWDREIARWFYAFSIKIWGGISLNFILDRFDDFWIGYALGKTPLGIYSQAYAFARYPRRIIAAPILAIFFPTFAQLRTDRKRLSIAFSRSTSLMIRAGFLFSLLFILTASEFVTLLGSKWEPMLIILQLMIVYTLLDPLAAGANSLLVAIGKPEIVLQIRSVQLLIFIPAVILLGWWQGIAGVAIAANVMVFIGMVISFRYASRFVDFSVKQLWLWPSVAVTLTITAVFLLTPLWATVNIWLIILAKLLVISTLYLGCLWLSEKEQLKADWQLIWHKLRSISTK